MSTPVTCSYVGYTNFEDLDRFLITCCAAKLLSALDTLVLSAWPDSARYLVQSACVVHLGCAAVGRFSLFSWFSFTTTWAPWSTVRPPAPVHPQRSTATSPTAATSSHCCPSQAPGAPGIIQATSKTFSGISPPCKCRYCVSKLRESFDSVRPCWMFYVLSVFVTANKLARSVVAGRTDTSWEIHPGVLLFLEEVAVVKLGI